MIAIYVNNDEELEAVVGDFLWKDAEYNNMADLKNAIERGLITEEYVIIIGNNIEGTPN